MNVLIFTLCDGAYNYNGKLTIVGTTDNIKVSKYPAFVSIGFAFKISFTPQETGAKNVSIRMLNHDGEDIMPIQQYPSIEPKTSKGADSRLCIGGNLQGIRFAEEGAYKVVVRVNNNEFSLPFIVTR